MVGQSVAGVLPIPDLTPAPASPAAAELYRRALVLDANTLAAIGYPIAADDPAGVTKLIIGSGVNVVKATLGGAQGNFEQAVAAIAKAELLMEKETDAFFKIDKVADFDRAKREGKVGVIYSFESAAMLEDKLERIELSCARDATHLQSQNATRLRLPGWRKRWPNESWPGRCRKDERARRGP